MPRTFRLLFCLIAAAVIVLPVGTPSAKQSGSRLHLPKNKIPEDAKVILEQAEQFELLSLSHFYPPAGSSRDSRPPVGSDFYHYEILGRTEIRNAKTRENLVSAFEKGVAENNGERGDVFQPSAWNPCLWTRQESGFCDLLRMFAGSDSWRCSACP